MRSSDGNKRVGAVVAEAFLIANGAALDATNDEVAETFIAIASGELARDALDDWFRAHVARTGE